ncbi:zinc finger protein 423-like, partial [Stegodyphus dumicola]|uniref:zinc finger protein 423-like n=1 Tax=Stegodyphus dumicola TaxID=202533 RepID=UPI0015B2E539
MHVLLPPAAQVRDISSPISAMRLMEVIARLNGGIGTPTSWRSTDTPDDQSLSPTSCTTLSDPDAELTYTIGVTENTPYACHFCDKAFPRLSYLKRHEQVHSEHMPFKCDFCQRLFKHKRSRDRHVKLHTGDRKYRCGQCEAAFSRSDHLKIHMKTHDNAKPYQCAVCNRGYNTAAALTSHMQNHKKDQSNNPSSPSFQHHPFRCLQCTAGFSTSKDLQMHVATHDNEVSTNEKALQCNFCSETFSNAECLRQHVEQKHAPETQGKCPECMETFASLEALLQHKKNHEEGTPKETSSTARFACGFCTKNEFPTMDSLQQHMQESHVPMSNSLESSTTHASSTSPMSNPRATPDTPSRSQNASSTNPYGCEYCTMRFSSLHGLQKHTLSVHSFSEVVESGSENVYCSQCNKAFSSTAILADHVRTMHEREANVPKDYAEKKSQSRSKNSSPRHLPLPEIPIFNGTTPHFPSPGTFLCSQCNAALPDFESFRTHLKTHLDAVVKKFSCSECDGQFPTEELLDAHVANHYLATATEYGCQSCLKMFVKPDHLQKHLMDIHAHQLFQCALCKEIFDSKVNIQVHFAVKHSNECHLYKCTSCNSMFRTEIEFHLHVKVAHLAKMQPFRCFLCDLCFPTELQLQLHLQSHKKPFSCVFCREEFHVEYLLDRHIQEKHSTENLVSAPGNDVDSVQNLSLKPCPKIDSDINFSMNNKKQLRCDICDASFAIESSLSVHRRQVHNIRTSGSQKPGQTTLSLFCAYCNE